MQQQPEGQAVQGPSRPASLGSLSTGKVCFDVGSGRHYASRPRSVSLCLPHTNQEPLSCSFACPGSARPQVSDPAATIPSTAAGPPRLPSPAFTAPQQPRSPIVLRTGPHAGTAQPSGQPRPFAAAMTPGAQRNMTSAGHAPAYGPGTTAPRPTTSSFGSASPAASGFGGAPPGFGARQPTALGPPRLGNMGSPVNSPRPEMTGFTGALLANTSMR